MIRGTVNAGGFILDVGVIGEAEARRRVLAAWSTGATLRALPDGRWLLLLARPVMVRAERAPGLPVVRADGELVAGGEEPAEERARRPGSLAEVRHGALQFTAVDGLEPLSPAAWLELPPVVELEPLEAPERAVAVLPVADPPDLRSVASLPAQPADVRKLVEPISVPGPAGAAKPPKRSGLNRLLLRSPLKRLVAGRHLRYLRELTRAFERGNFEDALRDAIGLGGEFSEGDWFSLRLPTRRQGDLAPTARLTPGGGSAPWGADIYETLRELYRGAARKLEAEGEIERAAFVYADLLGSPQDAVVLLERHGRLELAAQLAEGRHLDPDLVVRLWWLAGRRGRAVAVARARGAWRSAVERVAAVDPDLAVELRAAWVQDERERGDHRAAISAAWPDPDLRDTIGPDLDALSALGPTKHAAALALKLAWRPDPPATEAALALLTSTRELEKRALLELLSRRPAADQIADRRLAGAGVRAILRDGAGDLRDQFLLLRNRADPLLRVDLPTLPPAHSAHDILRADAPEAPGPGINAAVALELGVLIAARGGVSLHRHDGRELARWDVPATELSVADHGGSALLGVRGESLVELHRLDLATRKLTRGPVLPSARLLDSYDGATVVAIHDGALAGIDTTTDPPRILWSELDGDAQIVDVARSPRWMSAIVDVPLQGRPGERSLERWTWELPSRRLRSRQPLELAGQATTADGTLLWIAEQDGFVEHIQPPDGARRTFTLGETERTHLVAGEHSALWSHSYGELLVTVSAGPRHDAIASLAFPEATALHLRAHGDLVTVYSDDGRVVAIDVRTREAVANFSYGER